MPDGATATPGGFISRGAPVAPRILVHAGILDVDVASEASVEEQVPARVMIVVVDIDAVALPFPIAAAIEVDRGDHPIRIVVEHDAAGPEIHSPRDEFTSHVFVAAVRIRPPGPDTVVVGIPVRMRVVRIVPAFVISVVMPIAAIVSVFVIAFVLPVVVAVVPVTMVIVILIWCGHRQRSGQSQEHYARYHFAHKSSLSKVVLPTDLSDLNGRQAGHLYIVSPSGYLPPKKMKSA